MLKRTVTAILVCAVMVLVAAIPFALATTEIIKGEKGPNASAKTWEYVPATLGIWYGHIVNMGLRWLVVDVYDNTNGVPQEIMHQRIRFAAWDAYPSGEVNTSGAIMKAGHTYLITATPNGPRGTKCTVEDMFKEAKPPVAVIGPPVTTDLTVTVDGSGSYDQDGGTIVSYSWNWGDMTMDTTGTPATHTYAMAGMYTITLTVTDNDGLTDDATVDVEVREGLKAPVASFDASMDWMTVTVTSTSTDADGTVVGWDWDFGDGTLLSGVATATHTYLVEKTYTIKLTVTDNDGLTGWTTKDVVARAPHPPVASFTWSVDWLTVTVTSTSTDSDGTIVAVDWNFGDGATASGSPATHTYATKGDKTITLTVKDNDNLVGTASDVVTLVDNPPVAVFTYSVNGLVVTVDAKDSTDDHGIVSYVWNWGDGSPDDTGMTATHTYPTELPGIVSLGIASTGRAGPPPPPFPVQGQVNDTLGNPVNTAVITITNMRSGAVNTTGLLYPDYGYYEFNLNDMTGGIAQDDLIKVSVVSGSLTGENQGTVNLVTGYLYLDVIVSGAPPPPPYDVVITLTVTDALGQTASVSQTVRIVPP